MMGHRQVEQAALFYEFSLERYVPADCLQFHLAASAYHGEVFLLFLVHCDRPLVGPIYEVIFGFREKCPQRGH